MKKEFERFTISQVAVLIRDNKCLILEFTDRPGHWGLPGGRIDEGEACENAFRRELKEELSLKNFEILNVVDFDAWLTADGVPVSAVAFLIKNAVDEVKLSNEHISMKWVSESELDDFAFLWPNAKRMLQRGFNENNLLSSD